MAKQPTEQAEYGPLFCAGCGAELKPGSGDFFQVNIEAVADPAPPNLQPEEMEGDLRDQIKTLIARMGDLPQQEIMDQVYRRFTIHLCTTCYGPWIENPAG